VALKIRQKYGSSAAPGIESTMALPPRDRLFVIAGLAGIVIISWAYLVVEAGRMGGMLSDMTTMVKLHPRDATELVLLFLMWAVMMVAMMIPSALPMILFHAAVVRKMETSHSFAASVGGFVAGYIAVWTLFSITATFAQAYLEHLALLSPMMVSKSAQFGGVLLVVAGLYQMSPIKDICLRQCRSPFLFVATHWRDGIGGAFQMGFRHGLFCVGCCWLLMALLFVGGVMNLLWVAAISIFVMVEKVAPLGRGLGHLASVCMVLAGILVVIHG
jgi:predicted metal-binding membrane protein